MKLNFDKLIKQKHIDLSHKGLNDDDLDVLYKVIEESTVLEWLDLSDNNLTLDDGVLTDAVANNATIKVLNLTNNNIGLQGIKLFADVLKKENTTLKGLSLAGNNIGDEGAKSIADMLVVNKSLQVIELHNNHISLQGFKHLADVLKENKTLEIKLE